jgi:hypothetical protein
MPYETRWCSRRSSGSGWKLALYDGANDTTCEIEDQSVARSFAGQKVKVTGTYNSETRTLTSQRSESY